MTADAQRSDGVALGRPDWGRVAGVGAALLWALFCLRWFDVAAPLRPPAPERMPAAALAVLALVLGGAWLATRWRILAGPRVGEASATLWLALGLAFLFRLPLAWQGAAGYVSPDGALSGIVALRVQHGLEHLVFVPSVPYSGSLKSHLTALLALAVEPPRAFALVSVLFYLVFVAAVHRLALLADRRVWTALASGLYLAFAPAFVTRYSLSNDGNYVEVLALGSWALVLAVQWLRLGTTGTEATETRSTRSGAGGHTVTALAAGVLLGLAFWCHILALIYVLAVGLAFVTGGLRRALRSSGPLVIGLALGYWPGILWNLGNHWQSLQYVLPGGQSVGALASGPGLPARAIAMVSELWPVLLGYDLGYRGAADLVLRLAAWTAVVVAALSVGRAVRDWRQAAVRVLLVLVTADLVVVMLGLPYIPGNPRYLILLMSALPILIARSLDRARWLMVGLVVLGAVGSMAQAVPTLRADRQWRDFVAALEREGVRYCYADFHLATKLNFLSGERVVCAASLGPTTTEYFPDYPRRVAAAPEAALIAVNPTAADKLERRLDRLGVRYERRDLMKPVLLRLSRKVEPSELFPGPPQ